MGTATKDPDVPEELVLIASLYEKLATISERADSSAPLSVVDRRTGTSGAVQAITVRFVSAKILIRAEEFASKTGRSHLNLSTALLKTVLVVEDEDDVRFAIAEFLRQTGWAAIEVRNAEEAMRVLSKSRVDIAFVDFKLPGGPTGAMLAQWSEVRVPNLPVLLTSGLTMHASFGQSKLRRFIPKPYELSAIGNLLGEMLDHKRTT